MRSNKYPDIGHEALADSVYHDEALRNVPGVAARNARRASMLATHGGDLGHGTPDARSPSPAERDAANTQGGVNIKRRRVG